MVWCWEHCLRVKFIWYHVENARLAVKITETDAFSMEFGYICWPSPSFDFTHTIASFLISPRVTNHVLQPTGHCPSTMCHSSQTQHLSTPHWSTKRIAYLGEYRGHHATAKSTAASRKKWTLRHLLVEVDRWRDRRGHVCYDWWAPTWTPSSENSPDANDA
jgi:hypothetical protein